MVTYGKKKRSVLNSFYTLRDSESTSKPKKDKIKKQGIKAIDFPCTVNSQDKIYTIDHQNDSIEDLASILLNDTSSDELTENTVEDNKINPRTYLQPLKPKDFPIKSGHSDYISIESKGIEHTQLLNADSSSTENFSEYSSISEIGKFVLPSPRKLPKRTSGKLRSSWKSPNFQNSHIQNPMRLHRTTFKNRTLAPVTTSLDTKRKNSNQSKTSASPSIDSNLEYQEKFSSQGVCSLTEKQSTIESGLLTKLKNALNGRKHVYHFKKIDPRGDTRFLDSDMDELTICQDKSLHPLIKNFISSTGEVRMKDDDNTMEPNNYGLKSKKRFQKYSPVDNGLFLENRKSAQDQNSVQGTSDCGKLPLANYSTLNEKNYDLTSLIYNLNTPTKEYLQDEDFDSNFSSSPLAQSTPRSQSIALFEENEDMNNSFDSTPLFQGGSKFEIMKKSDQKLMTDFSATLEPNKRKGAQEREIRTGSQMQKRIKNHTSLSGIKFDRPQQVMHNISSNNHELISVKYRTSNRTGNVLAPKDKNAKVDCQTQPQRLPNVIKPTSKLEDKLNNSKNNSGKSRRLGNMPCKGEIKDHNKEYMMDIDELQLENSGYNIGVRWK